MRVVVAKNVWPAVVVSQSQYGVGTLGPAWTIHGMLVVMDNVDVWNVVEAVAFVVAGMD